MSLSIFEITDLLQSLPFQSDTIRIQLGSSNLSLCWNLCFVDDSIANNYHGAFFNIRYTIMNLWSHKNDSGMSVNIQALQW
jgi:hypothetical protein